MLTGGALFGSGLAIAGLGAHTHSVGKYYNYPDFITLLFSMIIAFFCIIIV